MHATDNVNVTTADTRIAKYILKLLRASGFCNPYFFTKQRLQYCYYTRLYTVSNNYSIPNLQHYIAERKSVVCDLRLSCFPDCLSVCMFSKLVLSFSNDDFFLHIGKFTTALYFSIHKHN